MNNVGINQEAKLSEHFKLAELCKTSVKTADGNIPSHVHIEKMKRVCKEQGTGKRLTERTMEEG